MFKSFQLTLAYKIAAERFTIISPKTISYHFVTFMKIPLI